MNYTNPIIKGFHPDPSVCFNGEKYYLVCSSFEYFPCLPIFESVDLLNWQQIGSVIEDAEKIDLLGIRNSMGLFAPTIRYFAGTYFVVCTNISQGNFICHTKNPEEGWSDPIWIDCPKGIDPSLTLAEGHYYYQLSVMKSEGNEIIQFEIDPFTGEVLSEIQTISTGCGGRDVEAPHIFEKDGYFYLVLAEGGTREGHMVTLQKSTSIWGPFEPCPHNPVLTNRDVRSELQAVGHGDFFADKVGNWWIVALATRPLKHRTLLGRETIVLPVEWEDGWPVVNGNGTATIEVTTDRLNDVIPQETAENHFKQERAVYLGLPVPTEFANNDIILENTPSELLLPKKEPVSFLSVSQEEYEFAFSCDLEIGELNEGYFGLAIYKDDTHSIQLGIQKNKETLYMFVQTEVLDFHNQQRKALAMLPEVQLKITGSQQFYELVALAPDGEVLWESKIATRHFTNEAADSPFTGVQLGLFTEAASGKTKFENVQLKY